MLTAVTEEVSAWQGPAQEAGVPVPVLGGIENRISQLTRVQLNQYTKLTYRLTIQQLHRPKEGKGIQGQGAGSEGPQVPTLGCALLLRHQGHFNFHDLQFPYLNS